MTLVSRHFVTDSSITSGKQGAHVHSHCSTIPPNVDNGFLLLIHNFIVGSGDGLRNVTQNQFCVCVTLWCNCLGSGQLLWLCEIDSEDAVTTGYFGVLKIILIIGLQMDSDGKWTILVHKAHKCAAIIAEPSLAHSSCMKKKHPTFEIS